MKIKINWISFIGTNIIMLLILLFTSIWTLTPYESKYVDCYDNEGHKILGDTCLIEGHQPTDKDKTLLLILIPMLLIFTNFIFQTISIE